MNYYYKLDDGTYISTNYFVDYRVGHGKYIEEIYWKQTVIDSCDPSRMDNILSDQEWAWILLKAKSIEIN